MKKIRFVTIGDGTYATPWDVEDFAAEIGPYEVMIFDGTTAGPRHPGTVIINAIKNIMKNPVNRRMYALSTTDYAKLEYGIYAPNDAVIDYLKDNKIITDRSLMQSNSITLLNPRAVSAVVGYLNKDKSFILQSEHMEVLPKVFLDCLFTPIFTHKRVKNSLLEGLQ